MKEIYSLTVLEARGLRQVSAAQAPFEDSDEEYILSMPPSQFMVMAGNP